MHVLRINCLLIIHHYYVKPLSAGTSPTTTHPSTPSSTTNNVIIACNDLLDELSEISDPHDFCLSLRMKHARCKQLINDGKDTRTRVYSIAEEWYNQQTQPTWDMVVEALWRHGHKRDAALLAKKKGLKLPQS